MELFGVEQNYRILMNIIDTIQTSQLVQHRFKQPNSSAESIRHPGRLVCFPVALAWSRSGGANVHSARCSTIATWPAETVVILRISTFSFLCFSAKFEVDFSFDMHFLLKTQS